MKPRFIFQQGVWYCMGCGAWGSGFSVKSAWKSYRRDLAAGSTV